MFAKLLWSAHSGNEKTGDMPQGWIGATKEETAHSCSGCALRPKREGGTGECYARNGTPAQGHGSVRRTYARDPERYTIGRALENRATSAKAVRLGANGDPAACAREDLEFAHDETRNAGLAVLAYTHYWCTRPHGPGGQDLKWLCLASTDSVQEADTAIAAGWIPTAIVPRDTETATVETPAGNTLVVCPAQRKDGVTCNTCRLCDVQARVWQAGKVHGVAFKDHSAAARRGGK